VIRPLTADQSLLAKEVDVTSGVRLLVTIIVVGATLFLGLLATGAIGLNDTPYVQIPLALFLATMALWPLLPKNTAANSQRPFVDWLAYNAALMLLVGLVIYSVNTWIGAHVLLEGLQK
jgi:hypothetical protein